MKLRKKTMLCLRRAVKPPFPLRAEHGMNFWERPVIAGRAKQLSQEQFFLPPKDPASITSWPSPKNPLQQATCLTGLTSRGHKMPIDRNSPHSTARSSNPTKHKEPSAEDRPWGLTRVHFEQPPPCLPYHGPGNVKNSPALHNHVSSTPR